MSFYNIGAGNFKVDGWVNVDMPSEHYASFQEQSGMLAYDLTQRMPLPVQAGSAEIVYSSHTIEHVDNAAVMNLLREAYRVLKPGGVLRLTTPCAEVIWRAYHNRDLPFFYELTKKARSGATTPAEAFLDMFGSQLCAHNTAEGTKWSDDDVEHVATTMNRDEALDHIASVCTYDAQHPQSHINWFTVSKLVAMVREAGFRNVYRSAVGQSSRPEMRDVRDFDGYHEFTLYVEAVR